MAQYRKKPVVIDAFQFGPGCRLPSWYVEAIENFTVDHGDGLSATIHTLEGAMQVSNGDWVIKGVKGELYPCKPDIFAATYDPA
jgi:hypothetical protein